MRALAAAWLLLIAACAGRQQTASSGPPVSPNSQPTSQPTSQPASQDAAWVQRGIAQERMRHWDDAEDSYKRALKLNPNQLSAWDNWARLALRLKKLAEVEILAKDVLAQDAALSAPHLALAHVHLANSRLEEAEQSARAALKSDERNVRGMQLLARVYYRQGKYELTRMVLENARAIDHKNAITHHQLGVAALALKQRQVALDSFRQAVKWAPDFAEARNNLGTLLNEMQDYPGAIVELEAAVKAAPDFVAAHLNLGNAYRGNREPAKALAEYQRALELAPELSDAYFNLGVLHLDSAIPGVQTLDRYQRAIGFFQQYSAKGGEDERVAQYLKDAQRALEKEQRRLKRAEGAPMPTLTPRTPAEAGSGKLTP